MNRNELVKMVQERAGISQSQAETAVNAVLEQLKARLPAPLAGQIDGFLDGGEGNTGGADLSDLAKRAGGMFRK